VPARAAGVAHRARAVGLARHRPVSVSPSRRRRLPLAQARGVSQLRYCLIN